MIWYFNSCYISTIIDCLLLDIIFSNKRPKAWTSYQLQTLPHMKGALDSGSRLSSTTVARASAISAAMDVTRHGCLLMAEKDTSKAARNVLESIILSIFGRMMVKEKRKKRHWRTMGNIIFLISAGPAEWEYANYEQEWSKPSFIYRFES